MSKSEAAFVEWMKKVNAILGKKTGMHSEDLTDWTWRDSFEDGMAPEDAVQNFAEDCDDDNPGLLALINS
jgi:hypothetical protein